MSNQLTKLPSLEDLLEDRALTIKQNQLNILLNAQPKKEWLHYHPYISIDGVNAKGEKVKLPYPYMPIERIEYLLTAVFTRWWIEIKSTQLIANSVVVTVRLYVIDPITNEPMWNDGVGASPIQTDKDAGATEFNKMKSSAIQMSAPAAETYAIKDAAEKFGKIFGKDLTRKEQVNYTEMLQSKIITPDAVKELPEELKLIIEMADVDAIKNIFNTNKEYHSNPEFMQLLTNRKKELNGSLVNS